MAEGTRIASPGTKHSLNLRAAEPSMLSRHPCLPLLLLHPTDHVWLAVYGANAACPLLESRLRSVEKYVSDLVSHGHMMLV